MVLPHGEGEWTPMKARMMLRTTTDRERHLNLLARYLGAGEKLVRTVDSYREDDVTLHVSRDPAAEVVAVEPPTLMPGGVTEIASYVVCRGSTTFRRVKVATVDGSLEECDLDLTPVRQGAAA